jgi:shikimate dehydrogenase
MTRKFAVLGSPVAHSRSPKIHQAAYRVLNEDWSYSKHEVVRGGLNRFIQNEGSDYSGFSVTMPLKENAFSFASEVDDLAKATGAVNTLAKVDGAWIGFNTDVFGITQAVSAKTSKNITRSLIVGSGATAASAVVAISQLAPQSILRISARNKKSRGELVKFAQALGLKAKPAFFFTSELQAADLVVSTLPGQALDDVAQKLSTRKGFRPQGVLLDVAYEPWPSKIAQVWSSRGSIVTSGKDMLVWQALAQIRIFKFGNPQQALPNEVAVLEAMRIAVDE